MDMYKKIKQKLTEEFEQASYEDEEEVEDNHGSSSILRSNDDAKIADSDSEVVYKLRKEVSTLQQNLEKNYNVYIKRLEKRKSRIKELEDYTKLILRDNETINAKLIEAEACKVEWTQCKERLDQLEGHQNQELSKIKHMLLGTETALDLEKSRRVTLENELKDARANYDHLLKASVDVPEKLDRSTSPLNPPEQNISKENKATNDLLIEQLTKVRAEHSSTIELLQEHIRNLESRLSQKSNNLDEEMHVQNSVPESEGDNRIHHLEKVVLPDLRTMAEKFQQERDMAKASQIEIEIAKHEMAELARETETQLRLKIAQLRTEKETLEVTLDLRDGEMKTRKEEFRAEKERTEKKQEELQELLEGKSLQFSTIQAESHSLQLQVKELSAQNEKLGRILDRNILELEAQNSTIKEKDATLKDMEQRLEDFHRDFEDIVAMNHSLEANLCQIQDDFVRLNVEKASVKEENADLKMRFDEEILKVGNLLVELKAKDEEFPTLLETSDLVKGLRESNQSLSDELTDKKQSVKVLQQRISDMKKTFQKELKTATFQESSAMGVNEYAADNNHPTQLMDAKHDQQMNRVDLAYLKHVIFKFLTSREYEAKHLTRAIATLLHFTPEEQNLLSQHLEWKMSWFGSKPYFGAGQFSLSIEPS